MSTPERRRTPRAPRNTLSRGRVLDGAVELADRDGLEALTIRALATHLGVRPMALYHHVPGKDAMLDAIVDAVYGEVHRPSLADRDGDGTATWRSELTAYAASMRDALARHPWALALMESRASPGATSLANHEAVLEVLRASGFSLAATAHAYATLDAFVYGFALQAAQLASIGLDDDPETLAAGMDVAAFPRMGEFVTQHALRPGYDFGDSFAVGLEIVLDGLERLRRGSRADDTVADA